MSSHLLLLPLVTLHLVLLLLLSLVLCTLEKCKTCPNILHLFTVLSLLICKLGQCSFRQSLFEPRMLGHKLLEPKMLGYCIFCFVLFASCKSLSLETQLWHGNASEKVGASLHESSLDQ
jgi:hypothetical protein